LAADTYGLIRINPQILTTNTTISEGYNGSAAGPITISNNVTLMVSNNSTFTVF